MDEKTYNKVLSLLWDAHQLALDAGCFARGDGHDEVDNFGLVLSEALASWATLKGELPVD